MAVVEDQHRFILHWQVAGCDKEVIYQCVHMLMNETFGKPWQSGEVKGSSLVFISRNLPKQDMLEALEAYRVSDNQDA